MSKIEELMNQKSKPMSDYKPTNIEYRKISPLSILDLNKTIEEKIKANRLEYKKGLETLEKENGEWWRFKSNH